MDDNDDIVLQYSQQLCDLTKSHQLGTSALLQTIRQLQTALCKSKATINKLKKENKNLRQTVSQRDKDIATLQQNILDMKSVTPVTNHYLYTHSITLGDKVENKIVKYPTKEFAT